MANERRPRPRGWFWREVANERQTAMISRGSGAKWPMNVGLDLERFWREVANERQTAMISRGSGARWPMNVDLEKGSGAKWPMNQEDRLAFAKRALVVWLVGSH